jgi:tetratricopeptide (TPR) repeat protein
VAAVFAAGLMAKPMIVTLPLVLLLLDVWPLGRWDPASGQRPAAGGLLFEKLPLFGLSLAAGVVTVIVQARAGAVGGLTDLPLSYRLSNATVSYLAYVGKMVWPADLAAFYPYPASLPPWWLVGLSFAAIAAAAWAAVASARTRPYVTVGILWYLVTLLPVSGLIQAGDQLMADRFTYLPSIGLIVAVVWGGADLVDAACRRLPKDREWVARALVTAVIAVVLVACATVSRAQVAHWRNSETLWTRALAVTTGNHRAHAGLAEWQAERGLMDKAIANYREAVRLAPAGGDYRHALGMALARPGQTEEASRELAEAVRLNPGRANARVSLAAIMVREGRVGEAVSQYREALRIEPRMPQALSGLGFALVQEGRFQEAAQSCLQAAQLDRQSFDGRMCAGLALARLGDASRAAAEFHEATVLDPSSEAAFVNLGIALTRVGPARKADAIAAFEKALRINPANEAVRGAVEELRR